MLHSLASTLALAGKSLLNRRATALLTVMSIAVSVALLSSVERVRTDAQTSFSNTISGTDLIIGARSGELNSKHWMTITIARMRNSGTALAYSSVKTQGISTSAYQATTAKNGTIRKVYATFARFHRLSRSPVPSAACRTMSGKTASPIAPRTMSSTGTW